MEITHKGYRIRSLGTYPMVKIMPPGSGEVPNELKGVFTTTTIAKQAIDRSLSDLVRKGRGRKKDAKESSTSTG